MKKLIFGTILLLYSCSGGNNKEEVLYDSVKLINLTNDANTTAHYKDWDIFKGNDGHDYLESDGGSSYVLIHYPDCEKCLLRDSLKN